jgi:hypothetical protein
MDARNCHYKGFGKICVEFQDNFSLPGDKQKTVAKDTVFC